VHKIEAMNEQQPSTKIIDEHVTFEGANGFAGKTRVRIYNSEAPLILVSELDDNEGPSVTNAADLLWPALVRTYLPERMEHEPPAVFVEHYPALSLYGRRGKDDYSQVTFPHATPKVVWEGRSKRLSYGEPRWRHIGEEEVIRLAGGRL